MSDQGEKTCPLCAEEMDLTDQQLKPCKCGYEICVWCWHHIMDMAEKDNTEGRCPACRTPYDKEKIVGTASKCGRLVAEMSVEKKQKSQKGKTKISEGRKQLSNVRVIQRNLVYIMGLPLNLADEDLLQQKDYFGQYGEVLKVSISRTAAGAIQQFTNNTCSLYVTYSKEEEAVRTIQSVNGFVLEGRPLRACFGTTKYCHAWLRNVPCTNPDCLYLHEFGPQEDSFSKDEIVSAYTRNRVQQITGATNDMQQRSGNLLPPPADDYTNNSTSSWGKPISKSTTNNPAISMKVSPPNSSSERCVALPAAASWGARASITQPLAANVMASSGPSKQKANTCSTPSFSTVVVSPSLHGNEMANKHREESHNSDEKDNLESMKQIVGMKHRRTASETPFTTRLPSTSTLTSQIRTTSKDESKTMNMVEISSLYSNPPVTKDLNASADEGRIHDLSSEMSSSMSVDRKQGLQIRDSEQFSEHLASDKVENSVSVAREQSELVSDVRKKVAEVAISEEEDDLRCFNHQRLRDTEINTHTSHVRNLPRFSRNSTNTMAYTSQQTFVSVNDGLDPPFVDRKLEMASELISNIPVANENSSNLFSSSFNSSNEHSYFLGIEGGRKQMEVFEDASGKENRNTALDLGESSIISNILSLDFDPWDESLSSPQNLSKLLGENEKQPGSLRVSSSRKAQNSNQSRFSFAREDECIDQVSNFAPASSDFGPGLKHPKFSPDFIGKNNVYLDKRSDGDGFSSFSFEESDNFASNRFANKISVSRPQVSAPPGFAGLSRPPPPGFTSHERIEHTFDNLSGNHMSNTSSLRRAHQAPASVNIGSVGDLEFMDPAILAVGGRIPNRVNNSDFHAQLNSFENEARLHLLMQRSFSQQNQHRTDSYGIPSRIEEQTYPNNIAPYQHQAGFQQRMANGHWDGWNEVRGGNDIAMAELLRNERLGFNRYYSGHEDTKFRMPTSGDLYNRAFGI